MPDDDKGMKDLQRERDISQMNREIQDTHHPDDAHETHEPEHQDHDNDHDHEGGGGDR